MKTIGLCMIVKNEARVILRCLESVRVLVDYVLVEDTGSTDGTQDIVRQYLKRENLPGEVFDEWWRDFAHNRSVALSRLRDRQGIDYALTIDADDVLVCDDGFDSAAFKAGLTKDYYNITLHSSGVKHYRPLLCSNRLEFRYRGVLHEFLAAPDGSSFGTAEGFYILERREGMRSQNPDKYRRDAEVLERVLETETDLFLRSRYTFYVAQSWRDSGEAEKALGAYLDRAGLGFWNEEIYVSLYNAAQLKESLGHPSPEIVGTYLQAYEACPHRAEALHGVARYCRIAGEHHQGYTFAKQGLEISQPKNGLFIEPWIYEYGLLDEFSVNSYWIERYQDCLDACERLLNEGKIPVDMRERVEANARFARDRLGSPARADSAGPSKQPEAGAPISMAPSETAVTGGYPSSPRVLLAILAKQKEPVLPFYLMCIEALDYPKDQIVLYIRTNNNTDRTAEILKEWLAKSGDEYAFVYLDDSDVPEAVETFGVHEWNAIRFSVLGQIRQESIRAALRYHCEFYFVIDVDNFLYPQTLRRLIDLDLPIVAPFLRHSDPTSRYSNFHDKVDENGYFKDSEYYTWILDQKLRGICSVAVVHCTYLVRRDAIPHLSYDDGSGRFEYVIFSDTARKHGVNQYLDNREIYGYLTLDEDPAAAARLIGPTVGPKLMTRKKAAHSRLFFAMGLPGSGSTWLFNLAREICRAAGRPFRSLYADSEAYFPWEVMGSELIIVKSHWPWDSLQLLIASTGEPVVITVRDPLDCVVSHMRRFKVTFDESLQRVAPCAEKLLCLSDTRAVVTLRYEDGFANESTTLERVSTLLGLVVSRDVCSQIMASLSPEAVRAKIEQLSLTGAFDNAWRIDTETQWHLEHLHNSEPTELRDVLTPYQQNLVRDRTRGFCERFGYGGPEATSLS